MRALMIGVIAAVAVAVLMSLSQKQSALKSKGVRLLTWPAPMRWFTGFMIPFSIAVAWMASQAKPSQAFTAGVVATCFLAGAVYMAYCVFLYRVWWTTEGIGCAHPLGRTNFIPWTDVQSANYVASVQAFYVKGNGRRVWYSPMQSGIPSLHRYLRHRLRAELTAHTEDGVLEH